MNKNIWEIKKEQFFPFKKNFFKFKILTKF